MSEPIEVRFATDGDREWSGIGPHGPKVWTDSEVIAG